MRNRVFLGTAVLALVIGALALAWGLAFRGEHSAGLLDGRAGPASRAGTTGYDARSRGTADSSSEQGAAIPALSGERKRQGWGWGERYPGRVGEEGPPADRTRDICQAFVQLPLQFEENRGQTDRGVKFLTRGDGATLYLTQTEAVLCSLSDRRRHRSPPGGA